MTARSSRNCLQARGHAFHWLLWFEQGTRGWPKRRGASPNRPFWSDAAVRAPEEGRSREATTRCINGLENVNRSIYGPSQTHYTLVLERIPATSAPTVQTAKRCHVWLFRRLEPLVQTLLGHAPDHFRNFIAKICNQQQWRGPRHARADQQISSTGHGQQSRVLVSRDQIIERVLVRHAGCDWAGDRLSWPARHRHRALTEGKGGRPARSGRLGRVVVRHRPQRV